MIHTIETLKELHEQRFAAVDKAMVLAAEEMSRRLDILNHFHELAREKGGVRHIRAAGCR
jgi:hypothetical protein